MSKYVLKVDGRNTFVRSADNFCSIVETTAPARALRFTNKQDAKRLNKTLKNTCVVMKLDEHGNPMPID